MGILLVYLSMYHKHTWSKNARKGHQILLSYHVGAVNQTHFLCKSKEGS